MIVLRYMEEMYLSPKRKVMIYFRKWIKENSIQNINTKINNPKNEYLHIFFCIVLATWPSGKT